MLLVPFQIPQAPSVAHNEEITPISEEGDLRASAWGDFLSSGDGDRELCMRDRESDPEAS